MNTLIEVRPGFWRVLHQRGQLLGYVERASESTSTITSDPGGRYATRRVNSVTRTAMSTGDFARLDDAVESFR